MKKFFFGFAMILLAEFCFGQNAIVVVPPQNLNNAVTAEDIETLTGLIEQAVVRTGRFEVVDRGALANLTEELKFQMSDWSGDAKSAAVGKAVNANFIFRGSISKSDSGPLLMGRIVDVNTTVMLDAEEMDFKNIGEARTKIDAFVSRLTDRVKTGIVLEREAAEQRRAEAEALSRREREAAEQEQARAQQEAEAKKQAAEAEERRKADEAAAAERGERLRLARLFSLGIAGGSSFTAPWAIAQVNGTVSLLPYTFFDIGCDVGFIHGYVGHEDKYFSLYPFLHLNFFAPFGNWGGLYAGGGAGVMLAFYENEPAVIPALDATGGFYFGKGHHYITLSYTLRTSFESLFETMNHKTAIGYSFRF